MAPRTLTAESLTQSLRGETVSHVSAEGRQRLCIHFSNGVALVVETRSEELAFTVEQAKRSATKSTSAQPTKRQFEYLSFIAKYIARFGRSPAESEIERHFFVSAPSVNQMMQPLERRGFIARQKGVPRSVRICIELPQSAQHGANDA